MQSVFLWTFRILIVLLIFFALFMSYAVWSTRSQLIISEISVSDSQRIDKIQDLLLKNISTVYANTNVGGSTIVSTLTVKQIATLPTTIADPHFLEERHTNGFASSSCRYFYAFKVPQEALSKWTALFVGLNSNATYEAPLNEKDWWLTSDEFNGLTFYEALRLTGYSNGWIGVNPITGEIFAFASCN